MSISTEDTNINETISMTPNTTTLRISKSAFDRKLTNLLGGYMSGVSLVARREGAITNFTLTTYPHTHCTRTYIIGAWAHGTGTYCNNAVTNFKRK